MGLESALCVVCRVTKQFIWTPKDVIGFHYSAMILQGLVLDI